jgi:hypothetical protein
LSQLRASPCVKSRQREVPCKRVTPTPVCRDRPDRGSQRISLGRQAPSPVRERTSIDRLRIHSESHCVDKCVSPVRESGALIRPRTHSESHCVVRARFIANLTTSLVYRDSRRPVSPYRHQPLLAFDSIIAGWKIRKSWMHSSLNRKSRHWTSSMHIHADNG